MCICVCVQIYKYIKYDIKHRHLYIYIYMCVCVCVCVCVYVRISLWATLARPWECDAGDVMMVVPLRAQTGPSTFIFYRPNENS